MPPPPSSQLHILTVEDTLDLILENPKSFCRYGDGEVALIKGRGIAFQKYDPKLSKRLLEILQSRDDKCYIGINGAYFRWTAKVVGVRRLQGFEIRSTFLDNCSSRKLYIDSGFTIFYSGYTRSKHEQKIHFNKFKELFRNRKLVIFSGRTVFDKINYNVFEYAAERVHVFTESKHAWNYYDEIMNAARQFPKDFTLCFILGPTATVLAYDLAQEGYTAWDIGHVAKDYDAFMKGSDLNDETTKNFFDPD